MSILAVLASVLVGVWVVETILLVLSYRTNARDPGAGSIEPLL
jgi:hypothetical protein